jgi:hypothetical protein
MVKYYKGLLYAGETIIGQIEQTIISSAHKDIFYIAFVGWGAVRSEKRKIKRFRLQIDAIIAAIREYKRRALRYK